MLLTGTYERILDNKLRLAVPKSLREAFATEQHLILTIGTDGSLALYAESAFRTLAEKVAAKSPTGHDVRAFSRLLCAQSQRVEVDGQGRIRVPPELARLANLENEVVLLGVGDRVELWNKSRWEAYLSNLQPRFDELAESALSDLPANSVTRSMEDDPLAHPPHPR